MKQTQTSVNYNQNNQTICKQCKTHKTTPKSHKLTKHHNTIKNQTQKYSNNYKTTILKQVNTKAIKTKSKSNKFKPATTQNNPKRKAQQTGNHMQIHKPKPNNKTNKQNNTSNQK